MVQTASVGDAHHPSGVAASLPKVRAKRAGRARIARPYGVAATPLYAATASGWQPQSETLPLRAQRVLKGKWVIDKREKTAGCLPLARSAAAEAAILPVMRGQFLALSGEYTRMARRGRRALRSDSPRPRGGGADSVGITRTRGPLRAG